VLVVTVDLPLQGPRERDVRNGFTVPPRIGLDNIVDYARRLGWLWRMANGPRITFGNLEQAGGPQHKLMTLSAHIASQFDASVSWKDLDWLRSLWPGKLAIKGILHPADARLAVEHGADAIIVSNHGGRQLDSAPSAIAALPDIVAAVDGRASVLMDGGVRRGSDVVKAMALGASACLIGRAGLYGLAAGGEAGVTRAVTILQKEIDIALALLGVPDISRITRAALR
jgi:L-lactate dehydrogenase (cytochrome)